MGEKFMRIKGIISYNGKNFYGYQIQEKENEISIQKEIQDVLKKIFQKEIKIYSSGRTDRGVHAENQCIHFDIDKEIDLSKLKHSMNCLISKDIYIKSLEKVDETFHARFSVKSKTYRYVINFGEYNPFLNSLVYNYNTNLDISYMEKVAKEFIGEHSFHNFCSNDEDFIRTIFNIDFIIRGSFLIIDIEGNGFRRYMVRMIIGTLIRCGEKKLTLEEVKELLKNDNFARVSYKAPSEGLYLHKIKY